MRRYSFASVITSSCLGLFLVVPSTAVLAAADTDTKQIKEPSRTSKRSRHSKHEFNPVSTFDDPYGDEQIRQAPDPLEKINRGTFAFNHQFYRFVAKPIADVTKFMLPKPVRTALGNAIENLETPVRVASCLLQAISGLMTSDDIDELGPLCAKVSEVWVTRMTSLHAWNRYVLLALIGLHVIAETAGPALGLA